MRYKRLFVHRPSGATLRWIEHRYHLLKYAGPASRLTCPNCGKRHYFAPYVDDNDQIVGEQYGRCDHESSCGYVKYPPSERDWRESWSEYQNRRKQPEKRRILRPEPKPEPPGGICTIPMDIVLKKVRTKPLSDLLYYLCNLFDVGTIMSLVREYSLGVTRSGDIVYYQIDQQGRCRTGKVMKYNRETGHRIKDPDKPGAITWVHSLLKQLGVLPKEWTLSQALFGEHLLKKYPDKPVCLVEAEKTALICATMVPVWVAVGGKTQLGDKVEVLYGRTIIAFPDADGYDKWKEKIDERPYLNIQVVNILEKSVRTKSAATVPTSPMCWSAGFWRDKTTSHQKPQQPPSVLYADNPVMQEVMNTSPLSIGITSTR